MSIKVSHLRKTNMGNVMKKESKVTIKKAGIAYIIKVNDEFTKNALAVTIEELEQIVLYGQAMINKKAKKDNKSK